MSTDRTHPAGRPSMSDVAAQAGVALGTVSNYLNNPDKVSERTRRRVAAAIAELGYVRNDAARSLAAGSSTTIGLVVADLGNSLFVDIARGAETVLRRRGFNLLIVNSDVDPDREVRNLELLEQSRVAGILLAPLDTPLARTQLLPVRSTPTVFVNFASATGTYSGVTVDERHGGALATRHLIGLGRRRLLFTGGPLFLSAVNERAEGAAAVAAAAGVELEVLESTGLNVRHGRQIGQQILAAGPGRYDGIVAASDLIAIGIAEALGGRDGYRIPEDIALTGYDDNHFASEHGIPITTVSQQGEELGRVAADLLVERITRPSADVRTVVVEPLLIPRRSTLGDVPANSAA